MTGMNRKKLPVGVQSFIEIREKDYKYVDKSAIIWNLANNGFQYNYLIRPRRFGKSVLVDTLQAYFEGRKELFEGLKIMQMEKDWLHYPVIRLDMSGAGPMRTVCALISTRCLRVMRRSTGWRLNLRHRWPCVSTPS